MRLSAALAASALSAFAQLAPPQAYGVEHEIKVFTDQIRERGERGIEFHLNTARPPDAERDERGRPWQFMTGYAYGFARHWQASLQLPASKVGGTLYANGAGVELLYVAPHDRERGFYWGVNHEIAYSSPVRERSSWQVELVPIIGGRIGRWHMALNPRLELPVSGEGRKVTFKPAGTVLYGVRSSHEIGIEFHSDLGPIANFLPRNEQSRTLYAVWNVSGRSADVNVGIGRGLTDASDRWIVKAMLELELK